MESSNDSVMSEPSSHSSPTKAGVQSRVPSINDASRESLDSLKATSDGQAEALDNLQALRDINEQLESQNHDIISSFQRTKDELHELQQKQSETAEELDMYRKEFEVLQHELDCCTEKIFSLQPPGQVTDTDIRRRWETICESVNQWIDDESGLKDEFRPPPGTEKYKNLLELATRQSDDGDTPKPGLGPDNHFIDEYLTRRIIHKMLYTQILCRRVDTLNIPDTDRQFITKVERGLKSLLPRRGKSLRKKSP